MFLQIYINYDRTHKNLFYPELNLHKPNFIYQKIIHHEEIICCSVSYNIYIGLC